MVIALRTTADAAHAVGMLRNAARSVGNIIGKGGSAVERLQSWRAWVSTSSTVLSPLLTDAAIRTHVRGDLHDLLQTVIPELYGDQLTWLVDSELIRRKAQLEAAADELDTDLQRWTKCGRGTALVLDTNVLLEFGKNLAHARWFHVANELPRGTMSLVIPIQVVEELDGLKDRGAETARKLARATLRWIDELFPGDWQDEDLGQVGVAQSGRLTFRLLVDELDRIPLPRPDADIIDRALSLGPFVNRTTMVSQDRSMRFRARAAGLDATPMRYEHVPGGKQRIERPD
jgi:hypothetical protein